MPRKNIKERTATIAARCRYVGATPYEAFSFPSETFCFGTIKFAGTAEDVRGRAKLRSKIRVYELRFVIK